MTGEEHAEIFCPVMLNLQCSLVSCPLKITACQIMASMSRTLLLPNIRYAINHAKYAYAGEFSMKNISICIEENLQIENSANKWKVPWNKGRKHSEETRERIRQRTKEAMEYPKVKSFLLVNYFLAADMKGMGFIQSNHFVIMYNNTMISFNMIEAARINGVKRSAEKNHSFC